MGGRERRRRIGRLGRIEGIGGHGDLGGIFMSFLSRRLSKIKVLMGCRYYFMYLHSLSLYFKQVLDRSILPVLIS